MKKIKWLLVIMLMSFWAVGSVFSASPALLKPGDVLNVTVQGEPDLSGDLIIDSNGSIKLPLIGSLDVAGMNTTEVSKLIKHRLTDGYIKNPLVTVNQKSFSKKSSTDSVSISSNSDANAMIQDTVVKADRLGGKAGKNTERNKNSENDYRQEKVLVEIKDSVSNAGIADSVLLIGNNVYQSNRLGQILINKAVGERAVVIADGYKPFAGYLDRMLRVGKSGYPYYIALNKVSIPDYIICTVVDTSNKPVKNAEIRLDGDKILTDGRGEFKICGFKKEFGEVVIKKRGYKVFRKIVDFKESVTRTFVLTK